MKKLGFGLMRLPLTRPEDQRSVDQGAVNSMTAAFLDRGFTYFDTAYAYHGGVSEGVFKKAVMERYGREAFTIADKMPMWLIKETADYQRIFDEQTARTGAACFDYYLLHALDAGSYAKALETGGFEFVQRLKAEGKIRRAGFSFHDKAPVLDQILTQHPEMEFVQLQINYIDWEDENVQSRACYETARKHGKPVIVMEPVKGGCLASPPAEAEQLLRAQAPAASAASWAIRFAASLDGVLVVLSGMSTMDQLEDNMAILEDPAPLTPEEGEVIRRAAGIIGGQIAVPCTGCGYCVEGCPQRIPIPRYFTFFNDQKRYGLLPSILGSYSLASKGAGKASGCVSCGQCEAHCPQHIPIPGELRKVAAVFES
ncbi:MAG: aldo/keto reductase [Treponema sp.]|jgi:predicted aldo/keto reductase-like oxidoreductase|nr:aldo/keto reductase [Treponema sp.]